jgi:tetratricopeptide (TPR) repeat protein
MRTRRLISVCLLLVLAGGAIMPAAMAWGPKTSRAICLCALQVLRRDFEQLFDGREEDLVAGAMISDREMARYAVQGGQIEPFEPIVREITLLREANERGVTDYLVYRFGVLAKMTANVVQPYGIPQNEEERKLKAKLDADIEEYIGRLKLQYRPVDRESIYYPARYFGERMRFIEDDKYFVKLAYVQGAGYDDYVKRAVAKHFEEAINTVSDVVYTVLTERKYFGEKPPSPRDLAQYYVGQVEYFLNKSRPREAEEAYAVFTELNPGLASPYEQLGDAYYRVGEYDRAMREYRRGLRIGGSWPEVEAKIVRYYTQQGAIQLSQGTRDALQQSRQAYEMALSVSPGNPVAVSGAEKAKGEIQAMDTRLDKDRGLLSGADRLFAEARAAQSGQDLAKAVDLYEKAAAVYSLITTEFKEEYDAAFEGAEESARAIVSIFSNALLEAQDIMNRASQAELDLNYEQAIRFYDRVPETVAVITEKYPDQYAQAQKTIASAEAKKRNAQTSLETQQTETTTSRGTTTRSSPSPTPSPTPSPRANRPARGPGRRPMPGPRGR